MSMPTLDNGGREMPNGARMRRRVLVFFGVFIVCAVASLSLNFLRPPIYLSSARVQISPPGKLGSGEAPPSADNKNLAFALELQTLNSRPLLEKVAARLSEQGELNGIEGDKVAALQTMLKVNALEGGNIVELAASGAPAALLARLVNTLIEVYGEHQAQAGNDSSKTELTEAREEARVMDQRVDEKKHAVETFRQRADIVSSERDENQTLARVKGLSTSLSASTDREAIAEGRVRALEQAVNEGKRAPQAKDNSAVVAMEQRLLQMREEWRALERQFTPQFLDMDANARALKTRIGNLEQQLTEERGKSQHTALADAREELASSKATTQRLQQQLAQDKQSVHSFSRRFGEFQTIQDELRGLEKMQQASRQRLLALEASELSRKPRMKVLEAAVAAETAWRPLYWRDAGLGLALSLLLGFLAVWFVEFFNRVEPSAAGPATVIIAPPWVGAAQSAHAQLGGSAPVGSLPGMAPMQQLSAPSSQGLRELADAEIRSLLLNASAENRPLLMCLLCGLTPAELLALHVSDLDDRAKTLTVAGKPNRLLPLDGPLSLLLTGATEMPSQGALFTNTGGTALTTEEVAALVTSSAYDANLVDAQSITPETLRHSYIAFLVRQGLRFSDLNKLVGWLSSDTLNGLAAMAPDFERVGPEAIDQLLPALRNFNPA
ncbi:tyrosine-type recombinase/integrase [Roseateles oligotrophus]|uniref:Tyrosine-type recombinase/integrase n=1 Tax=Roseateles oligotrophus TaxID=1769250 RepID=A0ABT2YIL8_9BURK|nr:tyrosine-type recombinase/integrase [Roseateles oligotrophus]MCV2369911.1 tyrosine-type recombinase/integrase [Roseateles oligotrophus]